jgi:superfamily II DNA/RNA helicase
VDGHGWPLLLQRRSVMLADEMGLGKTIQTVAMLEHLRSRENVRGPFLIIAPLSTLEHWKREFEDWTKSVTVALPPSFACGHTVDMAWLCSLCLRAQHECGGVS